MVEPIDRNRTTDERTTPSQPSTSGTSTVYSLSEEETYELGRHFARGLRGGDLVLLEGDLGLGKTVFARGIAAGLGIAPEDVSSPSFTLIQEYRGGSLPVFHVDLYRMNGVEEIGTLGLEEILGSDGLVIVEWGEKLPGYYRKDAIVVRFHDVGEGSRRIDLVRAHPQEAPPRGDA